VALCKRSAVSVGLRKTDVEDIQSQHTDVSKYADSCYLLVEINFDFP
jgi:hypothetical protein